MRIDKRATSMNITKKTQEKKYYSAEPKGKKSQDVVDVVVVASQQELCTFLSEAVNKNKVS